MCGISGIISFNKTARENQIRQITDIIAHRGPDDYGYFAYNSQNRISKDFKESGIDFNANVFFGHRRLSILDLTELGHQPMSYLDKRYYITYNGEVYNYLEIRIELEAKGYKFKSNTDTEVILASYHEWGEDCVYHFNGMWSFAILDTKINLVFCSRDRLGIKPFYYVRNKDFFGFGSEIKQLLKIDWVTSEVDYGILFDYIALGYYGGGSERTSFKSIKSLMGGYNLLIDLNTQSLNIKQYWDIDLSKQHIGKTDDQYAKEYYDIFYNAVELRMRSDVPLGTALSGGLDSSSIAVTVRDILHKYQSSQKQVTFTSITDYIKYDERDYAQLIIEEIKSDAFFTKPDPIDLFSNIDKIIWHHDEPFPNTSIYSGWNIAELVKSCGVTVSLDGQGPDEMLGGYFPFSTLLANDLKRLKFYSYYKKLNEINNLYSESNSRLIRKSISHLTYNRIPINRRPNVIKAMLFLQDDFFHEGLNASVKIQKKTKETSDLFLDHLYNAVKFGSLPGILRQVDRNSMAFSVESRVPFLDYRLVEYSFSLPNNQKINEGITKYVLRNALKDKMNEDVRTRSSKLGFVSGEQEWYKDPQYKDFFKSQLGDISSSFINVDYYNRIKKLGIEKGTYSPLLWKIINIAKWESIFLGGK